MAKSKRRNIKKWRQQCRDRKINAQTVRLVERILESVLGEKCKIGPPSQNHHKDDSPAESLYFSPDLSVWTMTEADKEFLSLTSKPKTSPKPKQMVPFFSIEGSFHHSTMSPEEHEEFRAKWLTLLNESNIDPNLFDLIQKKEVQARVPESTNNYDVGQPDFSSGRMSLPLHHQIQPNLMQTGQSSIDVRSMSHPMDHQSNHLKVQSDDEFRRMSLPIQQPGFDNIPRRMSLPGYDDETRRLSLPVTPSGFGDNSRRASLPMQYQCDPKMEPENNSTTMSFADQQSDWYQHESRRKIVRPKPPVKQKGRSWRKSEDVQPTIEPFCRPMPIPPPVQHIPLIPVTTPDLMRNFLQQPRAHQQFLYPVQAVPTPTSSIPFNVIPIGLVNGFAPFYPFPKSVFDTPEDAFNYHQTCKNSE